MEQDEIHQQSSSNEAVLLNQNFMQLRLDTRPMIADVKMFLSAIDIQYFQNPDTGEVVEKEVMKGEPLANAKGITAIVNILQMRANHHIVQGNTNRDEYNNALADAREEITEIIIINCYDWGINDSKLNMIIDNILAFLTMFLSRTIDNKERESYQQQFSSREVVHQSNKKESVIQDFAQGIRR